MSDKLTKKRIEELSEKWLNGSLTKGEQEEYDQWYGSFKDEVHNLTESDFLEKKDKIYQTIQSREGLGANSIKLKRKKTLRHIALVAASICIFSIATSLLYNFILEKKRINQEILYSAITPGKDQAILTLDNGTIYNLDSLENGEIFKEDGISIEKNENGELIYSIEGKSKKVIMNTVSTPKGGQFKIILPDGSLVWLNADSQLKFPSAFIGADRKVELEGEAYFEVAKNKSLPFKVITRKEEIEVLGTHFNVNSYGEEETSSIALLEGKVKVAISSTDFDFLAPGQQAVVKNGSMTIHPVNLSEAVAWKNGEFMFNDENMKSVMQKIARWYDIEMVLAPQLENISIWGTVSKYEDIREVLKVIEMTGSVHFKIEGRRIYVTK